MDFEKETGIFSQTDQITIPNAFVDKIDAVVFSHRLMVIRYNRHPLRLAPNEARRIDEAAQLSDFPVGIVSEDVSVILGLSMVVFEPVGSFVVNSGLDDIGPVELAYNP